MPKKHWQTWRGWCRRRKGVVLEETLQEGGGGEPPSGGGGLGEPGERAGEGTPGHGCQNRQQVLEAEAISSGTVASLETGCQTTATALEKEHVLSKQSITAFALETEHNVSQLWLVDRACQEAGDRPDCTAAAAKTKGVLWSRVLGSSSPT